MKKIKEKNINRKLDKVNNNGEREEHEVRT